MNVEEFRDYCLAKKGVTEEFPFDETTLVFKVMGKMFAACGIDNFDSYNLKCDPEKAIELRESFNGVNPGYHMNKKHWNTIDAFGDVPDEVQAELIDHSYNLVVLGLTRKLKEELKEL
ncbi:MAG: MmcQ-like protein [Crocinitomicaceae bacterium]|nr:MmcQ-like protein [Crocinitomicaceae bacterium]|tara:strand:- start:2733 stop:3086 length:354 start_codon:yes stop_codon:yes gene_type:complete